MNLLEEEKNHPKFQIFHQEGILDLSEDKEPIKEKEYWEFRTITIILRKSFHFLRKSFYFYIKLSN